MDKEFLEKQKEKLEEEKKEYEEKLKSIAKKNVKSRHDWITKFPDYGEKHPEAEIDEFADYESALSVSYILEKELEKVSRALEKIKKNSYGICEKCKGQIQKERLKIYPQSRFCLKCKE